MKNPKYVFEGNAASEGIFLRSKMDSSLYYYTYYDDNGEIHTSPLQEFWYNTEGQKESSKGENFPTKAIAITGLTVLLILNLMFIRSGNFHIGFGLIFFGNAILPLTNIIRFLWLSKPKNA